MNEERATPVVVSEAVRLIVENVPLLITALERAWTSEEETGPKIEPKPETWRDRAIRDPLL